MSTIFLGIGGGLLLLLVIKLLRDLHKLERALTTLAKNVSSARDDNGRRSIPDIPRANGLLVGLIALSVFVFWLPFGIALYIIL